MKKGTPIPDNEAERLEALRGYSVLDTLPEQAYDDIVFLASQICESPIALMSLVDETRQWFKSKIGIDASQTSREVAFCAHAIMRPDEVFVVEDTHEDERFVHNALVEDEPNIRFYAGAPLVTHQGDALGTLCVIDTIPRKFTSRNERALKALSRQIIAQLELRKKVEELNDTNRRLDESQQRLTRSNQDLQQFAYVAAHDLKQPLRMIGSFAELLADDLTGKISADNAEYLEVITSSAGHGQALIAEILAFSKLNSEQESVAVDLNDICADVVRTYAKDHPAAVVDCGRLGTITGDLTQIRQLVDNLVGNGLKYNDSYPPRVDISGVVAEDGGYVLSFVDNGIGIPADRREQIFQMFSRLHDNSTYEGTGIGLAMCDRVMELHDGRIEVHGAERRGSVFRCVFPASRVISGETGARSLDIAS